MNDERKYDEIRGPDRNKLRLDQSLQEAAQKGRSLKVKHIKKNYGYSSFVTDSAVNNIKFDQVLSRERAGKPFERIPEGAPFWKYNVKDAVITAPVKSYTFSETP